MGVLSNFNKVSRYTPCPVCEKDDWCLIGKPSREALFVFVWVFHRISGLLLILLVGLQIISGFSQSDSVGGEFAQSVAKLHSDGLLIALLVLLFTFHSLYGLRTILMDLGLRHERALFFGSTLLGILLFTTFLVFYFSAVVG